MAIRMFQPYATVVVLARGKFEVKDPALVKSCSLSLDYWGGVKVYVDGQEVVRKHLPDNATNLAAVAEDYPVEAFTTPDGKALRTDDKKNQDRLALRDRKLRDIRIPVSVLRKGANVVAIEVHAAPVNVKARPSTYGNGGWPPVGLLDARLVVSPPTAAVAHGARPKGGCSSDQFMRPVETGNRVTLRKPRFEWNPVRSVTQWKRPRRVDAPRGGHRGESIGPPIPGSSGGRP